MVFCLQDTFRLFDYRDKKPRPIRLPTMDNLPTIQEASSGVDCEEGSTTNQDTASVVEENVREKKSSTNDSKLVFCSRLGVVAVLLTTALVIAAMTYRVISKNEYETFKAEVCSYKEGTSADWKLSLFRLCP